MEHSLKFRASFRASLVPPALISSDPIGERDFVTERSSRGSVAKFRASLPVWTPLPKAVRSEISLLELNIFRYNK